MATPLSRRVSYADLNTVSAPLMTTHCRAGGISTALLTSPLDVLRTRLQSDFYRSQLAASRVPLGPYPPASFFRSSLLHFRETFHILFSIHRTEGWHGLFRGLGPNLTGVVPATAIKFYTYGNCKRLLPEMLSCEKDATLVHVISAATAGVVTGTATNPIWLVKTRLQLDRSRTENSGPVATRRYKNSLDCIKQVLQQEGIRGMYQGLGASYLGVIETTIHLVLYERMKVLLAGQKERIARNKNTRNQASQWIGVSSVAGISKLIAVLIAYPHEVISVFIMNRSRDH